MMTVFRVLASVGILLSSVSHACIPARMPTESTEPVTIKIADTYFQIPESYLAFPFLRVPIEREYIQFALPAHILFPSLSDKAERDRTIQIQLLQPKQKGAGNVRIPISNKVAIVYNDKYSQIEGISASIVENYIRSIGSVKAPETWAKDRELASKFTSGQDPCSSFNRSQSQKPVESAQTPVTISYADIIEGLNHRNEAIRVGAAFKAGQLDDEHRADALKRLQAMLKSDSSDNVRVAAAKGILEMAAKDGQLIPFLIDTMLHDKNEPVRRAISNKLASLGSNMAEKLVPLLEEGNETRDRDIGYPLVWIINNEVRENSIASPDGLSPNAQLALHGVITILNRNKDERTIVELVNSLQNSKSAVAAPEYIAVIVKQIKSGPQNSADGAKTLAVRALKSMAPAGSEQLPLLIKILETDKVGLYPPVLEALAAYKEQAADAVPLIVKLTSFTCSGTLGTYEVESVPPSPLPPPFFDSKEIYNPSKCAPNSSKWVRSKAMLALGAIGVVDDDVIQALTRGLDDPEHQVRFDAVNSLVTITPDKSALVPILQEMLKRDNHPDVLWAIEGLGRLGVKAKPAIKDLEPFTAEGQNGQLQKAAEKAINQIIYSASDAEERN